MRGPQWVEIDGMEVSKYYLSEDLMEREVGLMSLMLVEGVAPHILRVDLSVTRLPNCPWPDREWCGRIVMRRMPMLQGVLQPKSMKYRDGCLEMVRRLDAAGWSHRDVHIGNVVIEDGTPRLIDWEHAIPQRGDVPYDLFGTDSGVVAPIQHAQIEKPVFWNAPTVMALRHRVGLVTLGEWG